MERACSPRISAHAANKCSRRKLYAECNEVYYNFNFREMQYASPATGGIPHPKQESGISNAGTS